MPFLDTPAGRIAHDREGSGPPVVLVGGAFQFRGFDPDTRELAAELGRRGLTAVNYDRPGRGESTGAPPFTLAGEIAVLRALAAELGPLALYGSSSGAAISLAAAAAGVPVTRLVLWEPPVGGDDASSAAAELAGLRAELATGDTERAVLFFMRDMPADWREGARRGPAWPTMCALAPSLEPDLESIAWTQSGPSRRELLAGVTAPTLVLVGERTLPMFPPAADSLTAALPDARQARVAAAEHRWELPAMADALSAFLLPG
jgi:pimeloyl-ACP methyl ester carboxylesterase